jgi:hypothetical protein
VTTNFDAGHSQIKQLTVYVRSDEKVGYHDTIVTSIFYCILSVTYVIFFLRIFYWAKLTGKKSAGSTSELLFYHGRFIFPPVAVIAFWEVAFILYYYFSNLYKKKKPNLKKQKSEDYITTVKNY